MNHFIRLGVISEVRTNLAKIAIDEMVTDYLPIINLGSNSFKCGFTPLRVGEQVVVLPINGSLNSGVAIAGLAQSKYPPPHTNHKEEIIKFEDGVSFSYNTDSSTLSISSPKAINIDCTSFNLNASQSASITAPFINLTGNTTIKGNISTSGASGDGGSFSIKGAVDIKGTLNSSGEISTGSKIIDSKGDLTNHSHNDSDGGTSNPR